ncbi:MAG: ion channel [Bacteroidota bacterium]
MKLPFRINTEDPNYIYFLISLILLLVIPPVAPLFTNGLLFMNITYGLVLTMGVIYAGTSRRDFLLMGAIAIVMFVVFLLEQRNMYFSIISALFTLVFFTIVLVKILHYILINPIGVNEIYACITGYLILGTVGAPLFFIIDNMFENAFQFPNTPEFYDFIYFSFITLTSVGYGDISPIHPFARAITVLISVLGQLYLTILIAIIIGKFLSGERD